MKASLIQMNSQPDKARNIEAARRLMARAVEEDRPDLLVLPECFDFVGGSVADKLAAGETLREGPAYHMAQAFAREHRVFVHAGSLWERVPGEDRNFNTTVVFDRDGREVAVYRKIHLFDIVTPDGMEFRESASVRRGEDLVTYALDGLTIGCAICYDLRFAELFLGLARQGADVIVLPSAFTLQTGKDHWEVLARARAIETQTYLLACGQWGAFAGAKGEMRFCYGHSLVCDPWGHVVAKASDGVGHVTARIAPELIARVRADMPVAAHRVLGDGGRVSAPEPLQAGLLASR